MIGLAGIVVIFVMVFGGYLAAGGKMGIILKTLPFEMIMIGGAAEDPSQFDADSLFSPVRITIAPIFIVAGFLVIMYSIMKKPKSKNK